MDLTVDPCEDFYQFSCGNYMKKQTVPDDRSSRNVLQEIQDQMYVEMKNLLESEEGSDSEQKEKNVVVKKAKDFYASCMRESTEEDEVTVTNLIINLIENSGGKWCAFQSMLLGETGDDDCRDRRFDVEKRLADAFMNQIPSIFNMYVASPEDRNNTTYALHVSRSLLFWSTKTKWLIFRKENFSRLQQKVL